LAGVGDGEADVADWEGGEVGIAEGDVFRLWNVRGEAWTGREFTYSPDAEDDTLVPGFVWMRTDTVNCFGD